jgi:hypothetical protein
MNGFADFYEQTNENPVEVLIRDFLQAMQDGDPAAANMIISKLKLFLNENEPLNFLNASKWAEEKAEEPDQIIENLFDVGDKLAIIGSSKTRKSFNALQLCLCAAAGENFLGLNIPQKRNVIYIQLEIRKNHCHLRLKRMIRALGINPADIDGRLYILNGRGLGLAGAAGVERIKMDIQDFHPELIVFDPLYKIAIGVENAAEDMKAIMACFDMLAEETGAAVAYVHHDPKGSPGDRNIQDRGAGSNVLGRDYDAALALTQHAREQEAIVIEILQRNYPPIKPFSVVWTNEGEDYCFRRADDIIPEKKTSRTKSVPPLSTYYPAAAAILKNEEMEIKMFKSIFKQKTELSDKRISDFMLWAQNPKEPRFLLNEKRGRGEHWKKIRLANYDEV